MTEHEKTVRGACKLASILLLVFIASSCASVGGGGEKKKGENFKKSVEGFNFAFRWEDYQTAVAFLPTGRKEKFWAAVDGFKKRTRIIDYELRDVEYEPESTTAIAILQYQYYRTDAPTLEKVTFTQRWYYLEKDKLWKVEKSGFDAISKTDLGF